MKNRIYFVDLLNLYEKNCAAGFILGFFISFECCHSKFLTKISYVKFSVRELSKFQCLLEAHKPKAVAKHTHIDHNQDHNPFLHIMNSGKGINTR